MTIGTAGSQQLCLGNGATPTFGFNFVWDQASYIQVYYTNASGLQSLLPASQYTLNLNPPIPGQTWGIGGTVTYPLVGGPIASGTSLLIVRSVPYVQLTALTNQGNNFPLSIEQALDTVVMQVQQVANRTGQFRGTWASGVSYNYGDTVVDGPAGANSGNWYFCIASNVSSVWATDLAANDWTLQFNLASILGNVGNAGAFTVLGNPTSGVTAPIFTNAPIVGGTVTAGGFTSTSGNLSIGGTAAITGSATFGSTLAVTGNFTINTTKFTVDASTGNVAFTGNLAINTNKLTLNAANGNLAAAGTVQGTQLISTVTTGTAPLQVASTTPVTNLVPDLTQPNAWTGQQNTVATALTDGASIAWNLNTQQSASLTIGGARTLANPTNMVNGGCYTLRVTQDGTGSRTLAYGNAYKFPGGVKPVLSTTANAVDILTFTSDGTSMFGSIQKAFS